VTIRINDRLSIPRGELRFTASRSSGPGGQHVNKVSSRVTLRFDLWDSPSLTDAQKRRIARKLATRITKEGLLMLHAQRHRSQAANRALLIERFADLLREALRRRRTRRKTRPTEAAVRRRLEQKRLRGRLKRQRSGDPDHD
jgi:ribosome-associated protein